MYKTHSGLSKTLIFFIMYFGIDGNEGYRFKIWNMEFDTAGVLFFR